MALSPDFQAALDQAKANASLPEYTVEVKHEVKGVEFPFRFRAGYSDDAIETIGRFQDANTAGDFTGSQRALAEFIDFMATDETREQLLAARAAGIMDFQDLIALQVKVVERVSGHPSMSSSSSPPGSPVPTGASLTPTVSLTAPTLPDSV